MHAGAGHDRARPRSGQAGDGAGRGGCRRWRRGWRRARTSRSLFGRERYGLENHEVALADGIVTFPVNPAFASLNLAQAVVIVAYEWFKLTGGALAVLHAATSRRRRARSSCCLLRRCSSASSSRIEFFRRRTSARPCSSTCATSLRAWSRRSRTSRPCTASSWRSSEGRKGPARGGMLDGAQAEMLRALLAQRKAASRAIWRADAWPGARARAAAAPQSDRGRARAVGRA